MDDPTREETPELKSPPWSGGIASIYKFLALSLSRGFLKSCSVTYRSSRSNLADVYFCVVISYSNGRFELSSRIVFPILAGPPVGDCWVDVVNFFKTTTSDYSYYYEPYFNPDFTQSGENNAIIVDRVATTDEKGLIEWGIEGIVWIFFIPCDV